MGRRTRCSSPNRPCADRPGTLVLLSGDVPLLTPQTLKLLLDRHTATGAAATVLTAIVDRPHGYGRIVRSGEQIARIVEERDASSAEREIREINSGIYAFALDGLVRRGAHDRAAERAAGVLPARSRRDLPRGGDWASKP